MIGIGICGQSYRNKALTCGTDAISGLIVSELSWIVGHLLGAREMLDEGKKPRVKIGVSIVLCMRF